MLSLSVASESISPLWVQISLVAVWILLIALAAWLVWRLGSDDSEIIRKIVHIGTGNVILLAWWLDIPAIVGIIASAIASVVTLLSYRFPILPGINSVGRQSLGTFFYSVSIGILIAWFWNIQQPQYAVLGVLVMAWGDGLAALIGRRFGKNKYEVFGGQKSLEGSATMAIVTFTVSFLVSIFVSGNFWQAALVSTMVAVITTALETFSLLGIDNLTVPLGSATLAYILDRLTQGIG